MTTETFEVRSPSGEVFEVTAPKGSSEAQVLEYARQQFQKMSAPKEADPSIGKDIAKSVGSAPLKAASNLIGLPSSIMDLIAAGSRAAGGALGLDTRFAFPTIPNAGEVARKGFSELGLMHKPQTTQGRYLGSAVEGALTAPGSPSMLISGLGAGVGSEAGGDIGKQHGPAYEVAGKLLGGVAGGVGAGRVAKPLESALNTEQMAVVQRAKEMGMKLTPGQQTGNRRMLAVESTTESMPGGGFLAQQRGENLKKANELALKSIGEKADEITPTVLDNASKRIGGEFQRLTQGRTITLDKQFQDDLDRIVAEQGKLKEPNQAILDTIKKWRSDTSISSDVYQANRSVYATDARQAFRLEGGANEAKAKQALVKALDDAAERSLPPKDLADFKTARRQWANLEAIEAADPVKSGYNINPNNLFNALKQQNKKMGRVELGDRDLVDLSRMGPVLRDQTPNSGTPERLMWMSLLSGGAAGAGGYAGGVPGAMAGAIGSTAIPYAVQRGLMAPGINPYLSRGLLSGYERTPLTIEAMRSGLLASEP